jgi:DNA-binding beta-propeller fold protein YncE
MVDPVDNTVYVAALDENAVLQIDPTTDKIIGRFPLSVTCEPHGLAVNPSTNQGIIGCGDKDDQITVAWDFTTHRTIGVFDQAGAGDAVVFDAQAQHFYFAASNFTPGEVAVFNASPIGFLTAVPTSHRSHTLAYDEAHKTIYTYDGKHSEAGLWSFPDPVPGCSGRAAARIIEGAIPAGTTICRVVTTAEPT